MITISNLKKNFGETIASDIASFTINDGDILGLVGNNGAGKSTLFRIMLDLLKADDGTVTINDINPTESEEWKDIVGAYIDEGFLIDFLTPEEYFAFLGKVSGKTQAEVDERLKDFERFAAGEVFGQKKLIRNLSAGNKQKVGIIAALFNRPKIVILDEPFNFLDPSSQNMLKHLLTEYNQETGATILCSSHNLAHTVDISTRIALLEHGVIVRDIDNTNGAAAQELENYFEQ
jgi:ABC-2 type transport system ATP-binding protein